ncbi:MAG TPA: FAD-dependent oxidoreductase [Pirellulaceae bacterium]|nr:FAD-dependent oxidoreductase [Pirellulaceae bacterium]
MTSATQAQSNQSKDKPIRVAILGGGVGGMTAAHELVERGFEVAVYEMRADPGGKARSIPVPDGLTNGKKPLPGEHGFRFFPGFYKHIPDTMKRIPSGKKRVYDNLVPTKHTLIARAQGMADLEFPAQPPASPWQMLRHFKPLFQTDLGIPDRDLRFFASRLLMLLISCDQRRLKDYERRSWSEFAEADERRSPAYRKYCADGITRALVACQAAKMSARTGGYILLQLMFDLVQPGVQANRVLNGPTSEVWFQPWLEYLKKRGGNKFQFHPSSKVTQFHFAEGLITGVTIQENGAPQTITADYYISALPVEVLEPRAGGPSAGDPQPLITEEMKAFDPSLAHLHKLETEWMNGIQYYLDKDVPVVAGHTMFIDSPWSLTSISQKQFWPDVDLTQYGDGNVKGVLSVDISNWDEKGSLGKPARECTPTEIKDEVWKQIEDALNDDEKKELNNGAKVLHWFLDTAIHFPNPNTMGNAEPLLINTAGSWEHRPEAVTRIKNFFLAADFVRTHTDLATMEAANEAARRAVNGILKASGSRKRRCKVWPLDEPWLFAPLKYYDRLRFRRLPDRPPSRTLIWLVLCLAVPIWLAIHLAWRLYFAIVEGLIAPVWQWLLRTFWRS